MKQVKKGETDPRVGSIGLSMIVSGNRWTWMMGTNGHGLWGPMDMNDGDQWTWMKGTNGHG